MSDTNWQKRGRGFARILGGHRLVLKEGPNQWFWVVNKGRSVVAAGECETHIQAAREAEAFMKKQRSAIKPNREQSLALVRRGRRPIKMLTDDAGDGILTVSGVEVTPRSRAVSKKTTKKKTTVRRKSTKKAPTKKTGERKPREGSTKTVKAKNGRTMVFTFKKGRWVLTGNKPTSKKAAAKKTTTRKKAAKKTTKKAAKKTTKKAAKKTTRKKATSRGYRVTKGEAELARKLAEAREELLRCKKRVTKKRAAKKTAKKTSTRRKSTARGEGTITADQILKGAGIKTKQGLVGSTTTKGRGRRAKPMKVWACAGPTYTGCGGGSRKKGEGSKMIGHITDPRSIRRIRK